MYLVLEDELEILGAASAGAIARDINGDGYLQGPCPNCGTKLQGEFCCSCGQSAKDMQRPISTLFMDALNAIFSFDGRLARTLPALMFRPGHVTRSFLNGKRVRYVPPFRLFLIASVVFFLALFSLGEKQSWVNGDDLTVHSARDAISEVMVDGQPIGEIDGYEAVFDDDGNFDRAAAEEFLAKLEREGGLDPDEDIGALVSLLEGMNGLVLSRSEIFASVRKWTPRLSFLLLPFSVVSLTILHIWIRRIYIYHHVVVAMHLQTFMYFAATLAILFSSVSPGWAWGVFGVSIPVYLFGLLRNSYDTSRILNVGRIFGFLISTFVALILLIAAVSIIGANEVGLFTWDELIHELQTND